MFVNFFSSNAQPNFLKPETPGSIAYSKPSCFKPAPSVETPGSIASSCGSSSCGSSSSSSGGFSAVA